MVDSGDKANNNVNTKLTLVNIHTLATIPTNMPTKDAPIADPIKCNKGKLTWIQVVPVNLLNSEHSYYNWHYKISVHGIHICEGSNIEGMLPL